MSTNILFNLTLNTTLTSSTKNAPIIKLESKKAVPFEELVMKEPQAAATEAQAVALNLDTVKSTNPRLVDALDTILRKAYKANKQVYTNQVAQVANNQPSSLSPKELKQISAALDKTIADNTPAKTVEHSHTPRRPR